MIGTLFTSIAFFVVALWFALLAPTIVYFAWMSRKQGGYDIKINNDFRPHVSLIVATYNEKTVIREKLKNIQKLQYPNSKLQVIIVDSASTDGTLKICEDYLSKNNFPFQIELISEKQRSGKSNALNAALSKANGEIIATSDADSFWDEDALNKSVSYFADPSIGVVSGKEVVTNAEKNVYTASESVYKVFFDTLRRGESVCHSTWMIQGELALFRRSAFIKFEDEPGRSDDHGTALNIISNGYRSVFVSEAKFQDNAAPSFGGRMVWKSRRSEHLIAGVLKSINLKKKRKLPISWKILAFNFYFYVISPIIFFVALFFSLTIYIIGFQAIWFFALVLLVLVFKKPRALMISYITSNAALLIGLINIITKNRSSTWRKVEGMRP